jgi:uncharacterized membrane protein (DUF4010 family)
MLVEIAVVAPSLVVPLGAPLIAMLALFGVLSAVAYSRARGELAEPAEPTPPSGLKPALLFGVLYAAVLFAVAAAREHLGNEGLYGVAALSGLTAVDAITLSTTQLASAGRVDLDVGRRLVLIGALTNILFKGGVIAVLGTRQLLSRVAVWFGIALAAGLAMTVFWP